MNPTQLSQKIFKVGLILCLCMGAVGAVSIDPAQCAEPLKARLAYHWFPDHFAAKTATLFVEEVGKATSNKLMIDVFPSGQLYDLRQSLSAVSSGSVEMAGVLSLNFAAVDNHFNISVFGYFWPNYEKLYGFYEDTPQGRAKIKSIEEKLGIRIICRIPTGPTAIFSTKPLVGTVEELKGRKSRYQTSAERPALEALGMNGVSVSFGEVYTALTQGRIDTVQTNPSTMKASSWWEPMKYCQMPYTAYIDGYLVANAKWWDSLPADIRKIVLEQVAPRIGREAMLNIMSYSNEMLQEFEKEHGGKIATLSDTEKAKMVEIYKKSVWPVLAEKMEADFVEAARKYSGNE